MNEHQRQDKINQLRFEIEQAERRKIDCGSDVVCRDSLIAIIREKTTELRHLETAIDEDIDSIIDRDNNEYRDRHNRFAE